MIPEDLRLEESLFRELLDAAPDPIVIVREDGKIAIVNSEATLQFGYGREELVGQKIEIIVPARYRHRHVEQRDGYSRSPHTRPMGSGAELFACRKDGSEFPVEISLSPLKTVHGKLVISIIRDVSARKRSERELQEQAADLARSNAELEQFAYIASHDLQEPLRAIAGSCQLLERRATAKLDQEEREFIGFAVDGAKRMQALISDLLDYSRITTKAKSPALTECEGILRQVLSNLCVQIEETGAVVTRDPLPAVMADSTQLTQLFQNLINNAIKFRDAKPPAVHVSAKREKDQWVFSVRDNGIGIDPKYFDKIFVIFRRLHTRDQYPGTGIGLALCKKIVERHGGKLWLESLPGKGSTFSFSLPAHEA